MSTPVTGIGPKEDHPVTKGDDVIYWHDTGAFGMEAVHATVLRLNRRTVTIRDEDGRTLRYPPHLLEAPPLRRKASP